MAGILQFSQTLSFPVSQYAKILLHVDLFVFLNFERSCYSFSFYFVGVYAKRERLCPLFGVYGIRIKCRQKRNLTVIVLLARNIL